MAKAGNAAKSVSARKKEAPATEISDQVRVKQPHGSITAVMSLPPPTGQPVRPAPKPAR